MKHYIFLVAATAAFAFSGCSKAATVENQSSGKLTLSKPAAVTVIRGGMAKAEIKIARQGLSGEVTIRFTNLPKGVDIVESDSKIVGDEGTYTLRASDTADLVENFASDVTASAQPGNIAVSQTINVTVKEKQ